MKKILFTLGVLVSSMVMAQQKGKFQVETSVISNSLLPSTELGFTKIDGGPSTFNVGLNGGYFVENNLSLKLGAGYGVTSLNSKTVAEGWAYKAGMEYAFNGKIPVEVAWTGSDIVGYSHNPSFVTAQLGYNLYAAPNVIIKPLVRYDFSTTDFYRDRGHIGVSLSFLFN